MMRLKRFAHITLPALNLLTFILSQLEIAYPKSMEQGVKVHPDELKQIFELLIKNCCNKIKHECLRHGRKIYRLQVIEMVVQKVAKFTSQNKLNCEDINILAVTSPQPNGTVLGCELDLKICVSMVQSRSPTFYPGGEKNTKQH